VPDPGIIPGIRVTGMITLNALKKGVSKLPSAKFWDVLIGLEPRREIALFL
jgi:hypothetical protein